MGILVDQLRIEDPERARVMLHPLRSRILARLRTPASVAEVARGLGLPAPRVGHHVRRLREAGLVRRAGSRRVRNLVEVRWVALARTFVVSESLTPGGEARGALRRAETHRPLRNLVALGERLHGDSLALLDEAATESRELSTFATAVRLGFADAESRAAFLAELLTAVRALREKWGGDESDDGAARAVDDGAATRYTTIVACYPERSRV